MEILEKKRSRKQNTEDRANFYKGNKAAIICVSPLFPTISALDALVNDIANMLTKFGIEVEIFSLSKSDSCNMFYGYKQNMVKVQYHNLGRYHPLKFIDFLGLGFLGVKPSIGLISGSRHLLSKLRNYDPDMIVITDPIFAKVIQNYKQVHKDSKVKVIAYVDAPDAEFNFSLTNTINSTNSSSIWGKHLKKLLENQHFRYQRNMYKILVSVCNAIITPGTTPQKRILDFFPDARGKIFPFLVNYVRGNEIKVRRRVRSVRKIMFLSSYSSVPYVEAMNYIKLRLAPQFPEKNFLIHGKGCPEKTEGNVTFSGKHMTLEKLFDDIDLCIAPLPGKNTGIKLKVFDYFVAGKMVLGTKESFNGYNVVDGFNAVIENDLDRYPDRIRELEGNRKLMNKIQDNVHTALKGHYENDVCNSWSGVLRYVYTSPRMK